jgi:hypothetical protein
MLFLSMFKVLEKVRHEYGKEKRSFDVVDADWLHSVLKSCYIASWRMKKTILSSREQEVGIGRPGGARSMPC